MNKKEQTQHLLVFANKAKAVMKIGILWEPPFHRTCKFHEISYKEEII